MPHSRELGLGLSFPFLHILFRYHHIFQNWRSTSACDLDALGQLFIDHVDLQNTLFDVMRKYDSVAFGECQLFPSY